jgi:quinol monooxygenase YgiN
MINKIAMYKIKEEKLDEVLNAVQKFVNNVKGNEPSTVYNAFRLSDDNLSFIHFMSFKSEADEEKHRNAKYTEEFVKILYPNCISAPEFKDLKKIG